MQVKQLATELGVTSETVRFYTRERLVTPKVNPTNGYKEYNLQDKQRLKFIINARHLGFTVDDVKTILSEADRGQSPCPLVRSLIESRLEELERKFQEMQALRDSMVQALAEWEMMPDKAPNGDMICHLISNYCHHHKD